MYGLLSAAAGVNVAERARVTEPVCAERPFNAKLLIFNTEFIIFRTEFITFNAKFINFNPKFAPSTPHIRDCGCFPSRVAHVIESVIATCAPAAVQFPTSSSSRLSSTL